MEETSKEEEMDLMIEPFPDNLKEIKMKLQKSRLQPKFQQASKCHQYP